MEQLIVVYVVAAMVVMAVCAVSVWQVRRMAERAMDLAESMTEEYSERYNSITRQTTEFVQNNLRQVTDRMLESVDISLEAKRLENENARKSRPHSLITVPDEKPFTPPLNPAFDMTTAGTDNPYG